MSDHFWKLRCRKSASRCGAKHISKSKCQKTPGVRTTFDRSNVVPRGRHGTFKKDLHRCIFRGRHSPKNMFMRDVWSSGRRFPKRGCIFEHQIYRFAKIILRNRCSISYDLASIFRSRRNTLDR